MTIQKLVLAYSGGLDTSVAVRWIKEHYGCEVIAYCADVGQGEDLEAARDKALAVGVKKAIVDDLRGEFVQNYVFPAFRGAAIYESEYLLGTSLARPCIAEGMMRVVAAEGADAIAHGATGKGNDQVRFELAAYHFDPSIRIVAPWREWHFKGPPRAHRLHGRAPHSDRGERREALFNRSQSAPHLVRGRGSRRSVARTRPADVSVDSES